MVAIVGEESVKKYNFFYNFSMSRKDREFFKRSGKI